MPLSGSPVSLALWLCRVRGSLEERQMQTSACARDHNGGPCLGKSRCSGGQRCALDRREYTVGVDCDFYRIYL